MATATWMLRKTSTGTTLWQGEGVCPPEVVVDPAQLREAFALSFPTVLLEFGPGDFDLLVVSQGAAYRAGGVSAYTLPGKARVGEAAQVSLTGHGRGCEARIVTEESFDQEVAALTPVKSETKDAGASRPASVDPVDFQMLIKVVASKVLQRSTTWADRCRDLPRVAALARADRREMASDVVTSPMPLRSGFYTGGTFRSACSVGIEVFTYAPTCKAAAYLRLLHAYQEIEALFDVTDPNITEPSTCDRGLVLSLQMVQDAHLLYLIETANLGGEVLHPDNVVFDAGVDSEIRARAEFIASKDAEYGQAIRRHGIPGGLVRLWDKLSRYTNLKAQSYDAIGLAPKFESMSDSLKDLGGYALILAGLFQEAVEAVAETGGPRHPLAYPTSEFAAGPEA